MRLIDADALIEQIKKSRCTGCDNCNGVRCRACQYNDEMADIDSAPTVFESSNLTNGDMIFALNETVQVYGIDLDVMNKKFIKVCVDGVRVQFFDLNWWNAPYKKEVKE